MMDINQTYCNHFTNYINKTIMLYALNLYSDACQFFLNKTGKKFFFNYRSDMYACMCVYIYAGMRTCTHTHTHSRLSYKMLGFSIQALLKQLFLLTVGQ